MSIGEARRAGRGAAVESGEATEDAMEDVTVRVPGWDAFAAADRALRASPRVADGVMRAWATRTAAPAPPHVGLRHGERGRRLPGARRLRASTAAAACLIVALGMFAASRRERVDSAATAMPGAPAAAQASEPAAPLVVSVANLPAAPRGRARLSAAYRAVTGTPQPPLVTLAADPPLEGELLQIVRMRVPREALHSFGLSGGDASLSAVVEVDLVVGGDGLPRDIRRVRPVADASEP